MIMTKKLIAVGFTLLSSFLLLTGCGSKNNGKIYEQKYPDGAILPVMEDERKGIKSKEIELADFTLNIPTGYAYGKVDYDGCSVYYIWKDKPGKRYALELDNDVMMYIYEGLDTNSPHKEISLAQARMSLKNGYMAYFRDFMSVKNFIADAEITSSDDSKYYIDCFTGYSGDSISTTYSVTCYPKTYYGIYAMERNTDTSNRRWYGFIFSNDSEGEIFKKSEYESLFGQIKSCLNVSTFYTPYKENSIKYDPFNDVSAGRSYEQLANGEDENNEGLFYNTLLYYVEKTGRSYNRKNVDDQIPHQYQVVSNGGKELTWEEANEKAASMYNETTGTYGYLATITSEDEWEYIKSLMLEDIHYWIGGYRKDGTIYWYWAGGSDDEKNEPFFKAYSLKPTEDDKYGGEILWGYNGWITGDGVKNQPNGGASEAYMEATTRGWSDITNTTEGTIAGQPYNLKITHYIVEWSPKE